MGKITVINSLIIPKIIHSATVLDVPTNVIPEITKLLFNFLWGPRDKIKRLSVINSKHNLGLGMVDIDSFFLSLKAKWFK